MPKDAAFTMKLEPALCDARDDDTFLQDKVRHARAQRAAGNHASADEVETRFAQRRAALLAALDGKKR